jgi:hypothetical protein
VAAGGKSGGCADNEKSVARVGIPEDIASKVASKLGMVSGDLGLPPARSSIAP